MPKMLKKLKKEVYENYFNEFSQVNNEFFEKKLNEIAQAADKERKTKEISNDFVNAVHAEFTNKKGKIPGTVQADLNFFMIYYVFPLILKIDKENTKLLLDNICEIWSKQFKDSNISYTTYEILTETFRKKVWGIF